MTPSRTFTSQLRTARRLFVLSAASVVLVTAILAMAAFRVSDHWPPILWVLLTFLLVLEIPYAFALHVQWRQMSRQWPVASLADELREASRQVPDGHSRIYVDHDRGWAVHCTPRWRGADHFSRVELAELEDLDRAEAGDRVGVAAVTFRVARRPAAVFRDVWVDTAVKGTDEGEFHGLHGQVRASLWDRLKVVVLHHRTGVLTPDVEELGEVVRIVRDADRTWDVASSQR